MQNYDEGYMARAIREGRMDAHQCFFIEDFEQNDKVLMSSNSGKMRGSIVRVDQSNLIHWRAESDGVVRISKISEVIGLY